jgi:hypothetical protein
MKTVTDWGTSEILIPPKGLERNLKIFADKKCDRNKKC